MRNAICHLTMSICIRDCSIGTRLGGCRYNDRMSIRLRNACALVIALLVLAVSSQSVVCESACSSLSQRSCCRAANGSDEMDMSGDQCPGDMSSHPVADASGTLCHHASIVATEASASSAVGFNGVRWAVWGTLPSPRLRNGNRSIAKGPPFRRTTAGLLSVSLRV